MPHGSVHNKESKCQPTWMLRARYLGAYCQLRWRRKAVCTLAGYVYSTPGPAGVPHAWDVYRSRMRFLPATYRRAGAYQALLANTFSFSASC